jgi:hypothetical protein
VEATDKVDLVTSLVAAGPGRIVDPVLGLVGGGSILQVRFLI